MLRTAKRLGVKSRSIATAPDKLPELPLPAIAEARDGSFFIIARAAQPPAQAGEEPRIRALVQRVDAAEPALWTEEQLAECWKGRLVLMTTREALTGAKRPFDVTWFLPFLVKYRRPLIQVLIASFVIQIVALVSPIFFQLIIDKVLVHGTLSTLDVLAVGLTVIFVWETLLTSARQWLLSHTTSRVDAELGPPEAASMVIGKGHRAATRVGLWAAADELPADTPDRLGLTIAADDRITSTRQTPVAGASTRIRAVCY